jgi:hypothetical protein
MRPNVDPDEEAQRQMHLARAQGDAYGGALEHLVSTVALDARQLRAGDYWLGYALEVAQGAYEWVDDELVWQEPADDSLRVVVSVRDAADGRFVPTARVLVTLVAPDGSANGPYEQPLLWDPVLYQYGRNWRVASDGEYVLRVRVEPPRFARNDRINGNRFAAPVEVEFSPVVIGRPDR